MNNYRKRTRSDEIEPRLFLSKTEKSRSTESDFLGELRKLNNPNQQQIAVKSILRRVSSEELTEFLHNHRYDAADDFYIYMTMGRCLVEMSRSEDGLIVFNHMPPDKIVQLTKGRCLQEMGRYEEALAIFDRLDRRDKQVQLAKSRCLQEMGRHEEALAIYDRLDSRDKQVQLVKGRCLEEMGRYEEARAIFDRLDSRDKLTQLAKGRCLEAMGRYEEAWGIYKALASIYPQDRQVILAQGSYLEHRKSDRDAQNYLKRQLQQPNFYSYEVLIKYIKISTRLGLHDEIDWCYRLACQQKLVTPGVLSQYIRAKGLKGDSRAIEVAYREEFIGIMDRQHCDENKAEMLISSVVRQAYERYMTSCQRYYEGKSGKLEESIGIMDRQHCDENKAEMLMSAVVRQAYERYMTSCQRYYEGMNGTLTAAMPAIEVAPVCVRQHNPYLPLLAKPVEDETVGTVEDSMPSIELVRSKTPLECALMLQIMISRYRGGPKYEVIKERFFLAVQNYSPLHMDLYRSFFERAFVENDVETIEAMYLCVLSYKDMDKKFDELAMNEAYLSGHLRLGCLVMETAVRRQRLNSMLVHSFTKIAQYYDRNDLVMQAQRDARAHGIACSMPSVGGFFSQHINIKQEEVLVGTSLACK